MATYKQRARRAKRLKAKIKVLRNKGYSVKDIAECLNQPVKGFYHYAEGRTSPRKCEDYKRLVKELDMLIEATKIDGHTLTTPTGKEIVVAPVIDPAAPEFDIVAEVQRLKARNAELEATIASLKQVIAG